MHSILHYHVLVSNFNLSSNQCHFKVKDSLQSQWKLTKKSKICQGIPNGPSKLIIIHTLQTLEHINCFILLDNISKCNKLYQLYIRLHVRSKGQQFSQKWRLILKKLWFHVNKCGEKEKKWELSFKVCKCPSFSWDVKCTTRAYFKQTCFSAIILLYTGWNNMDRICGCSDETERGVR